jgi:hypothetical protein
MQYSGQDSDSVGIQTANSYSCSCSSTVSHSGAYFNNFRGHFHYGGGDVGGVAES